MDDNKINNKNTVLEIATKGGCCAVLAWVLMTCAGNFYTKMEQLEKQMYAIKAEIVKVQQSLIGIEDTIETKIKMHEAIYHGK